MEIKNDICTIYVLCKLDRRSHKSEKKNNNNNKQTN